MAASPLRHGSPRDTEVSVSPAFSQMGSDDLHSELATSVSSALSTVRIRSHKANFDLNIPIDPSASVNYFALESIKADFERHLLAAASAESDAAPAPAEAEAEQSKATSADQALFLASFLRFLAERIAAGNDQGRGFASELSLLWASWNQFHSEFLGPSADIHSFALSLGLERRQQLLRAYFEAYAALEAGHFTPQLRRPRLLEEAKAKTIEIYAVFGGQGNNRGYLDELQELYETYRPLVQPLLVAAEGRLCQLARSVASPDGTPHALYQHGYRLLSWIDGTGQRPPADYLTANPISGPMLFLTQLTQYYATCRSIGMTTAEVRDCFAACSGHSQGIIAATVFASAGGNDEFIRRTVGTLDLLFQLAFHAVSATACDEVEPEMQAEAVEAGHDIPTPMLLVNGLERSFLEPRVAACNAYLDADRQIYFSLVNGPTTVVLTGDPRALMGLIRELAPLCASPKLDQTKVPSAKRKPTFKMRFLPVDLPYHAPYLEGVAPAAIEAAAIRWSPKDLVLPVFSTYDGSDLRSLPDDGLVSNLCDQLLTLPVHWQDAIDLPPSATHIVDFGTGGLFGIGGITARNLQGRGIHTMIVSGTHPASADFYRVDGVPRESRWDNAFQPKLVKTSAGKLLLDTPMSRLLGRPPIMVAGMTPTTVSAKLNAAVLNAGYHIELAGGGLYNEKALRARVAEIQSMTEPGHGLTLNSLYINQRQWAVQLPAWIQMRREGLPLEGFCVAAGIPTPQKAEELLTSLREAGIRHVSFKPGSLAGIQQVCKIAAQNPDMGILLQWTGGRAGGHHSAEDFHQPILASYGLIRRQPNLVLVAGSGFTCDDDVWPYLSGEWSVERGASPMPFDGVLFGSRIMTAREAGTSLGVKQLIAQTPGCTDAEWQGTYDKPTGGILTVNSEMNEPIHQIANRATMLWAELDRECFSLPSKEKQLAYLAKNKTRLIGRLNRDFQKVWFAQNKDGVPQLDVADMTYEEVCVRMLSLLFVRDQARWIDRSHRTLFGDWCRRVEERFALSASGKPVGETRSAGRSYRLQSYTDLDTDPHRCLERLMAFYGHARTTQLTAEDAAFFHALCWRAGQKPPPFITRFGEDFATQFKKDSLWQAEDLDAVVDRDPQRVCILQGPIAVRGQSTVDEPVADVLGSVEAGLIAKVLDRFYGGDVSRVPEVEYLDRALFGKRSEHAGLLPPHEVATLGSTVVKTFKADRARTAPVEAWLASLAGKETGWLRALLCSGSVVRGKNVVANPMASLLRPRAGMTVEVTESTAGEPVRLSAFGAARSYGDHDEGFQTLEVARSASAADEIDVTVFEERLGEAVPLHLRFAYRPDQPWAPLHEIEEGRNDRTKRFFWKMWFDAEMPPASQLSPTATFTSQPKALEPEAIKSFCDVVGARSKAYASGQAPMDFAIAAGWEAIMQAAVASCDADLLSLVHLSNEFRMLGTSAGGAALQAGDVCIAEARVVSIRNSDTGKTVRVAADISRQRNGAAFEPVFRVTSEFFYRGSYADFDRCFELSEDDYAVTISSSADLAILRAKEWLEWTADAEPMQGAKLRFRFRTDAKHRDSTTFRSLDVTGSVLEERAELGGDLVEVARIDYSADAPSVGNPVLDYVRRFGRDATDDAVPLDTAYELGHAKSVRTFYAPASNEAYSRASGDFNPIHVNPYFASLAGLPGTITHGMFTSAATRRFVEAIAADGDPARCTSFTAEFSGMVLPGDRLSATLSHVAMRRGEKVISVRLVNQRDETVLVGEAQVRQPTTVYVFTGQGSQTQGMGMDLYASSDVARAIWDEAEEHLYGSLGISIIEIVRENPKSKTVFFGGASGQRIRSTYMAMDYVTTDSSGNPVRRPMFPSITRTTRSFTFESPKGLLFDTRFAQVALVLFELSAFRDAQHRGLIVDDAPFAGHSLGEYAALASVGGMMRLRDLVDVVFFRGLTMQNAVPRDSQGRSSYGMVAVAAAKAFAKGGPVAPDAALASIVDLVGRRSGELLQTVNFNVAEQQSVVAGHEVALWAMGSVLDRVGKRVGPNVESYAESADVIALVEDAVSEAKRLAAHGSVPLERGLATIPLAGIDVPFHSRFLESGIPPFRAFLQQRLRSEMVHPDKLVGRYIPNLTASPFALSREYVERIHDQTGSAVLERVLADWDSISAPGGAQELAATIVVELLTYQFASPVRWIETQDIFFRDVNFARLVEFGPGPILVGMANRTLAGRYLRSDRTLGVERKMLCSSKDHDAIGYVHSAPAAAADDEGPAKASSPAPAPTPAPAPAAPVVAAAPAAPVEAVEVADAPLDPVVTLKAILAQKMKLASSEVASSKTIKSMTGGRSTLQNEIIGDLQLEFSELPDRSEDLSIEDLGKALQPGYSGTLGKYTTALVARLVTSKMPGGFGLSAIKAQANKNWGLGPGRTDALLLEAITREPAQRLPNEAEATKWLQTSGGAAGGAVVSSQELLLLQAKQEAHAQKQIQALQDYLGVDVDLSKRAQEGVQEHLERVTRMFDDILAEHGDSYTNGIQGKFEPLHARHYESYWNWSRQNVALLFADLLSGKIDDSDAELATRCIALVNQLDGPAPLEHERRRLEAASGPGKALALRVCELLLACRFDGPSRYQDARAPLGPSTSLDARGNTVYKEVPRAGLASLEDYVLQMASSGRYRSTAAAPRTLELVQQKTVSTDSTAERSAISFSTADGQAPWLRAARKERASWLFDEELTQLYLDGLLDLAKHGRSYHGLNVLVTGAGKGSIAAEMVKRLLSGGARVIVTTSSFSPKKAQEFQKLYREWGGRGSRLTVVPFNQASRKDVSAVVEYVYSTLKVDIDVLVPFAAISENGRQIDGIDDQSELAHRIMLTNVVRLMGAIKTHKSARRLHNRPTQVILPLSFNHGVIGNDGLYGASKIGLETLLNSVRSEDWSDYLFVTGANIGICRGTDLMADLDVVAEGLERDLGLRTFSTHEMAFNLMGLLDPDFAAANQIEPVMLDLTGDASQVKNISYHMRSKTAAAQQASEIRRSLIAESSNEFAVTKGHAAADLHRTAQLQPRGLSKFAYPEVGSHELNQAIARSEGPLDLDQVIVVTGFAEVGPWGSSRTRWEMEVDGAFSVEGLIEMAWLTGKIRHFDGKLASGKAYVGWVDAKTGEPVHDSEVRARYEKQILEHAGIRLVEPELLRGFDPDRKGYTQEVQLNHDLEALEVSASEAAKYRLQHGDNVAIWEDPATGSWYMRLKKGASILLPKAVRFDRRVAGQLPTGWSAARYGIPDDIVAQTDETALYALVCVAEALVEAGIDDPYELFKHVHVSEVGTCLGSAMGGLNSLSKMFRDRRNDVEVQNDILQETFINTVAGWINLLLVSSCGPITPTVGACATALQSLDVAAETIRSGKAKIMVAGGYEGLSEESMFEFAQMKATASSDDAFQAGLGASEMSKPMTSGRSGFVESMGCGVQIVMSAATALAIGAPINGILAFSRTASDRQGRSIPAPGQGVLSTAAPLKRALASWGLGGDDVGVISMHGTSTKANDRNESDVYHKLLQRIGRTPGNAVPAMAQKWLCGHAKGGAAALAINGLMQSINSATVAGNRNADDIAAELRRFDYLMYPCTSLARTRTDLHAGLVTSFGFGQVGGAVLVLHGSHLLGRLSRDDFEAYLSRRERRQAITFRRMQSLLVKGDLVRIKEHAPYPAELESEVLLDPEVRAERIGDSYGFRLPLVTAGGDGRAVEEAA
ncbi:fatty acid synthase [Pseudozyma flocculosa PF-1]|uniref:fatty acid synthase n=1 Tax=Pseudozyma flocculosa PF-1 TaxID=1277687 RepID=UPI00045619FB|nr:fatty acid synthase [Pseudozyma flocculosa PF-1]EPQ31808.1 fatty acid synthase [Pseudozyma flocculosa PF-1]